MMSAMLLVGSALLLLVPGCNCARAAVKDQVAVKYQADAIDAPTQPLAWTFDVDQHGGLLPSTVI